MCTRLRWCAKMRPEGTLSCTIFDLSREEQCDRGFDLSTPGPPSKILVAKTTSRPCISQLSQIIVSQVRHQAQRHRGQQQRRPNVFECLRCGWTTAGVICVVLEPRLRATTAAARLARSSPNAVTLVFCATPNAVIRSMSLEPSDDGAPRGMRFESQVLTHPHRTIDSVPDDIAVRRQSSF